MSLSISERQQIYTRLAPVIGEEEAQALLDQFPASPEAQPVTEARLAATEARLDQVEASLSARIDQVEARLDHRIDMVEQRLDAKIDQVEIRLGAKIDQVEATVLGEMHRALRQQTILMITTIIAVVGFVASTSAFG